jgi:aspartyl/asparaginyl beta-hydroxylase (cupin superfamily)
VNNLKKSAKENFYPSAFDNSDKYNFLNDYLCSITDLQDEDIPLPDFDDRCPNTLTDITVVEQDIIEIISLLDPNKAVGPDRISNRMLSEAKYQIAGPLYFLFSKSPRDNIFPAN